MSADTGKRRWWSADAASDDDVSDLTDRLPENGTDDPVRFDDEDDLSPSLEEIRGYLE